MNRNKALRVLFFFNSIFVFGGSVLGPLYSIFVVNITNDVFSVSASWAIFMLVATMGTAFVAKFGDKLKEKEYLLLAGYLFRAIGWFGYLFVTNLPQILIIQVILGLGEAVGTPSFDAIVVTPIDSKIRVKEYSIWKVLNNLFIALGTLAGGLVVEHYGFPILFVGMSAIALIAFVGILVQPRKLL